MGYLGNGLTITGTQNSKRIVVDATPNQTISTVTGGYLTGQLDVYRNGVKLVDTQDYTASDGASVTFLNAVSEGDELEFVVFENFDVASALSKSGGSLNGDLVVTGIATFNSDVSIGGTLTYEDVTNIDSVGLITARAGVEIGTPGIAATLTAAGGAVFTGVVTATTFSGGTFTGDGTGLTGVASTDNINTSTLAQFTGGVGIADSIFHIGDDNTAIRFPGNDTFTVETAGDEAFRVDSSQRLLLGLTAARSIADGTPKFQVEGTAGTASLGLVRNQNNSGGSNLSFAKSRSASLSGSTIVQNDDTLGSINFAGADGTDINSIAASIIAAVDGTPGSNDMPGRLVFLTTADGAASATERLRITSGGLVGIGTTNPAGTLEIDAASTTSMITLDVAGTNFARLGHNSASGTNILDVRSEGHMRFLTNGNNERFRITDGGIIFTTAATAAGSLGVGTDSPGKVSGMSRYLSLSAAAADNAVAFELQGNRSGNDEPVARFSFINDDTETARITVDSGTGGGASGNMIFATGGSTERLRITSAGKVGINSEGTAAYLTIRDSEDGGNGNNGSGVLRFSRRNGSATNDAILFAVHDGSDGVAALRFNLGGSERIRIASSGQIGLGGANYGSSGQVIVSNGSGSAPTWQTLDTGGITTHVGTASGIVTSLFLNDATDHKVTVTGIVTFTATQSGTEGQSHTVRIVNSGIATVGFSTYFLFPSGSAPVLPTADGAVSLISFTIHDSVGAGCTQLLAGASLNFS